MVHNYCILSRLLNSTTCQSTKTSLNLTNKSLKTCQLNKTKDYPQTIIKPQISPKFNFQSLINQLKSGRHQDNHKIQKDRRNRSLTIQNQRKTTKIRANNKIRVRIKDRILLTRVNRRHRTIIVQGMEGTS